MSFGLINVPAIFQDYITRILTEKRDIFVIMYFNNILIYTKSEGEEHVQAV